VLVTTSGLYENFNTYRLAKINLMVFNAAPSQLHAGMTLFE